MIVTSFTFALQVLTPLSDSSIPPFSVPPTEGIDLETDVSGAFDLSFSVAQKSYRDLLHKMWQ
jgi:hypothetical protein